MRPKVSVILASCNGARYIRAQIETILACLDDEDELIVSDDGSTDGTRAIVLAFASADRRVRLTNGPQRGVMANVEHGLRQCSGELIFLSDQDDLWRNDKVRVVSAMFAADPELTCVVHDMEVVDGDLKIISPSYFALRGASPSLIPNLVRNSYLGAAMAFRASFLQIVLPIPPSATMHDQWFGMNSALFGKVSFLPLPLGYYRRHGKNQTELNSPGPLSMIILRRIRMVSLLLRQLFRHGYQRRSMLHRMP